MDIVITVDKLPLKGETVFSSKGVKLSCGGKGANQAVAMSKLGLDVFMIGKVGDDDYGHNLKRNLKDNNISINNIIIDKSCKTGVAYITVDKNGNNTIVVDPGANLKLTKNDITKNINLFDECDYVVLQMEIPKDIISFIIDSARKMGKTILLNLAPAVALGLKTLKKVDLLVLNETELLTLIKERRIETIIEQKFKKVFDFITNNLNTDMILTVGSKGSYFISKNGFFKKFKAFKIKPLDVTAAGDAFIGGLIFGLYKGKTIEESMIFANASGALAALNFGGQKSLPNRAELEAFLKKCNKMWKVK